MAAQEDKIQLQHPQPGKAAPRIARAKYDLVRAAILDALEPRADGLTYSELVEAVRERIPQAQLEELGSLEWYTVSVKLDLEARGEIERVPTPKGRRVRRAPH